MTAFWAIAALAVPWGFGILSVQRLRAAQPSKAAMIGMGWLVGQTAVLALVYASLRLLGAPHARGVLLLLALLAAGIAWWHKRRSVSGSGLDRLRDCVNTEPSPANSTTRQWCTAFFVTFVAASLAIKLYCLVGSHASILTRGDDAISIWLFKAKVITVLNALPMDPQHDYYMAGSNVHYPVFPPILAAWIPLTIGRWHEQLATLPWLFTGVNLFLLIGGGLRRWLGALPAWLTAYVVVSAPLFVVHVYRPGYADLPLAAFLAGAVLSLLAWRSTGQLSHLILAGLLLVVTACMKREGPLIATLVAGGFAITSWKMMLDWSARVRWQVVAALALAAAIVVMIVDFSEQADTAAELGYHPAAWQHLEQHAFVWASFLFLFWGVAAAWIAIVLRRGSAHRATTLLLTLGLCSFVAGIFVFTSQARFALNDQTPSRILLQLAPAIVITLAVSLFSPPTSPHPREGGRDAEV